MDTSTLHILSDSIARQQEIARTALAEAKKMKELSESIDDALLKLKIENACNTLIGVARDLARNSTITSQAVGDVYGIVRELANG